MPRLSWNEIRARAAKFADEHKNDTYERGEAQTFYNEFFDVFGVSRRRVATFETPVKKLGGQQGFIDLFWKGKLLVEQKSAGRDLTRARKQALEYFPGLKDPELPRYVLACDFQRFELLDLDTQRSISFLLADLPKHVEEFGFIIGVERRQFREQDPVNIEASELMGKLHDALKRSRYPDQDLDRLLVRLLFCLFADDTGIFENGDFQALIERTSEDGSDLGQWLDLLFQTLNKHPDDRQTDLDADIKKFEYINGDLFAGRVDTAAFTKETRDTLLRACEFSWDAISPAIFGALFQFVMNPKERREQGAHYTSERDILRVIEPLFLDDLRAEFATIKARIRDRERLLQEFHNKLASLTFFDPACGCGNFLVIAYRELRSLELELLIELYNPSQVGLTIETLSKLDVDRFFGIELDEFASHIAKTALYMMDHIMNLRLSMRFGRAFARLPLNTAPHIHHADAMEIDWTTVIPAERCSYVFGNPPFAGAKKSLPLKRQQVQRESALASGGTLDYVCAWFLRAGHYVAQNPQTRIGFVATNSISQGEQVGQLWPLLWDRHNLEITFAHQTFRWVSDARGAAHVHVVVIGLVHRSHEPVEKRLFIYEPKQTNPVEVKVSKITAYLTDGSRLANPHLVVSKRNKPLMESPKINVGSKPIDNGNLIFENLADRDAFLDKEPAAAEFIRPYVGADEFIEGRIRWILALQNASPTQLRSMPLVMERLRLVREFRTKSSDAGTQALAAKPTQFHINVLPTHPFLLVPLHTSEDREYVPLTWVNPPAIPSNAAIAIFGADPYHFGILTSRMHMAWLWAIGGKLESRVRYSKKIVYNNFVWPQPNASMRAKITSLAESILNVRACYPNDTLGSVFIFSSRA